MTVVPFRVETPQAALDDLARRLHATRWPEPSTVDGWAQGVPLEYLRDLVRYWADGYDWRATEARLNRIPQFAAAADGLDIHFLHVRSPRPDAVPVILTHGWPGSFLEYEAVLAPSRLLGVHLVPPLVAPILEDLTPAESAALADQAARDRDGSAYSAMHGTRPQTIGYALLDSPVALCAWIVEKLWTWTDHAGDLSTVLTRDQVLDTITLYWLTGTGASSARLYRESIAEVSRWFTSATDDEIAVPMGATVFPREVPRPSRRWASERFTDIVHWGEPTCGGHFGAWEQPDIFVAELTTFARTLAARS